MLTITVQQSKPRLMGGLNPPLKRLLTTMASPRSPAATVVEAEIGGNLEVAVAGEETSVVAEEAMANSVVEVAIVVIEATASFADEVDEVVEVRVVVGMTTVEPHVPRKICDYIFLPTGELTAFLTAECLAYGWNKHGSLVRREMGSVKSCVEVMLTHDGYCRNGNRVHVSDCNF